MRGLKLVDNEKDAKKAVSHPTWVRGLKQAGLSWDTPVFVVAPYVGAWIETIEEYMYMNKEMRRTLRGCVDWNTIASTCASEGAVAPYVGAWIETIIYIY